MGHPQLYVPPDWENPLQEVAPSVPNMLGPRVLEDDVTKEELLETNSASIAS
jgi:hypothetical protein